jgi:hypothetical protein
MVEVTVKSGDNSNGHCAVSKKMGRAGVLREVKRNHSISTKR